MKQIYIVTVRTIADPTHNPHAKREGACVAGRECTDSTGAHHSFPVVASSAEAAALLTPIAGRIEHVTRVEGPFVV